MYTLLQPLILTGTEHGTLEPCQNLLQMFKEIAPVQRVFLYADTTLVHLIWIGTDHGTLEPCQSLLQRFKEIAPAHSVFLYADSTLVHLILTGTDHGTLEPCQSLLQRFKETAPAHNVFLYADNTLVHLIWIGTDHGTLEPCQSLLQEFKGTVCGWTIRIRHYIGIFPNGQVNQCYYCYQWVDNPHQTVEHSGIVEYFPMTNPSLLQLLLCNFSVMLLCYATKSANIAILPMWVDNPHQTLQWNTSQLPMLLCY